MTATACPDRERSGPLPDPDAEWWQREFDAIVEHLTPPPDEPVPPAATATGAPAPRAARRTAHGRSVRRGSDRFPPTRVPGHQRSPPC